MIKIFSVIENYQTERDFQKSNCLKIKIINILKTRSYIFNKHKHF